MRRAVRFPIATMFVLAAACGGGPSSAPHYVITGTFWSGACESVSTYDQDGSPVHFERCLAVADARNDGGASQDPVLGELALVRGYDGEWLLILEGRQKANFDIGQGPTFAGVPSVHFQTSHNGFGACTMALIYDPR